MILGWFVNIRLMQDRLTTLWKYGGSVIRLFEWHDQQNCSTNVIEITLLKLRRTLKLSYFEENISFSLPILCKWSAL